MILPRSLARFQPNKQVFSKKYQRKGASFEGPFCVGIGPELVNGAKFLKKLHITVDKKTEYYQRAF